MIFLMIFLKNEVKIMWLTYLIVFEVGGLVCTLGQLLIIKTKMTSARILVAFVLLGVGLEAVGVFDSISSFANAGVNVPIIGFGASLTKGAIEGGQAEGIIGALSGGLEAVSGGIVAAVLFAFIFGLIFRPHTKKN